MGRLFDGVAALSGFHHKNSFEGESGLWLESLCELNDGEHLTLPLHGGILDWEPMIRAFIDMRDAKKIATCFHNTLAHTVATLHTSYEMPTVLGGGVFQNRTLIEKIDQLTQDNSDSLFLSAQFPINDGAIALGQGYFALFNQQNE